MDARVSLTANDGAPRSVALPAERTIVGRAPDAGICIDDEAVSWNHVEIERRGEVLMATDLDSRNGTTLNGEPLDRPRRLRDGDALLVGGHRLEISDGSARAGATVPAAQPSISSARRSGPPPPPWLPPTAPRAPSPAVPPPGPRSPPSCTSASAPPSAASTPSRPNSASPATPAAIARARSRREL